MGVQYIHKEERDREIDMAKLDADGMIRTDIEWTIEGAKGTRTGKLYGLHEQERINAETAIKAHAKRGDTITIREI